MQFFSICEHILHFSVLVRVIFKYFQWYFFSFSLMVCVTLPTPYLWPSVDGAQQVLFGKLKLENV